ncbi:SH3 domain-containing protein [Tropicimonas sp. IMCC34043]|uniref:SH3 domain-containing protein n=1 Tax=Tropicimonas sp. IMCC34043 TaxID=2248760 RepID=UPI000E224F01|nr:SH3 domain-containing protein [Tropicimonas sp. IMCC34043]
MLGRYVAGTVLILGVAMLLAPDAPTDRLSTGKPAAPRPAAEKVAERAAEKLPAPVAVPETASSAPAAPQSAETAAPVARNVPDAVPDPLPETGTQSAVEAAVIEAMGLDMADSVPSLADPASFATTLAPGIAAAPQTEAGSTAAPVADPAGERMFVTATRVNVRAGPSTDFQVVGAIDYGDPVDVLSREGGNWVQIRFAGGESGYVSRRFLAADLTGG